MKTLITGTFVCEHEDAEDVKKELLDWYMSGHTAMDFYHITSENMEFTKPLRDLEFKESMGG